MDEYKLGDVDLNDDKIDPVYKKGFEHGYWLQRGGSKDLDKIIEGSQSHTGYHGGLKAGKKEAQREKVRERLKSNLEQSNQRDKGIDID